MRKPLDKKIRVMVLERDNHTCQIAGCGSKTKLNIHHIKPVKMGGEDVPDNLITLCDIHHKGFHIEFSAYYPDSEDVLKRMNHLLKLTLSKLRRIVLLDDGYDLQPYLYFLTGHKKFRPGQLETIREVLKGKDVLFVAPTGIGKSICYVLPGMLADKPSIVISPTISLMVDATKNIWRSKIPATYINSELGKEEKSKRYNFISKNLYKFISMAPESYFNSMDQRAKNIYTKEKFQYLVVDEAHTIKTYGISFRSGYQKIGQLKARLGDIQTITLTATASRDTQKMILDSLNIKGASKIVTGIYRDNIEIVRPYINDSGITISRYDYIVELIREYKKSKILIFVLTVKFGEDIENYLKSSGIDCEFYHSRVNKNNKMEIQNRFKGEQKPKLYVLIATSAFGMGIDIADIRHIVHLGTPLNLTEYTQQIGRAGRDGLKSYAHLLYEESDNSLLEFMVENQQPSEGHSYSAREWQTIKREARKEMEDMIDFANNKKKDGEWQQLMDYFGEPNISFWKKHGIVTLNYILLSILIFFITFFIILLFLS